MPWSLFGAFLLASEGQRRSEREDKEERKTKKKVSFLGSLDPCFGSTQKDCLFCVPDSSSCFLFLNFCLSHLGAIPLGFSNIIIISANYWVELAILGNNYELGLFHTLNSLGCRDKQTAGPYAFC